MPRLIIFDDRVRGVELPTAPVVIGRSKRSDIPIRDAILSRRHCALVPEGATHRLVDLRSAHGTYLNGRRVQEVELKFEDVIEIGSTVMVFLDELVCGAAPSFSRLRNPLKAQEIVERLAGMGEPGTSSIRVRSLTRRAANGARAAGAERAESDLARWELPWRSAERGGAALAGLLSEVALQKAVSALAKRRRLWRRLVVMATREALSVLRESGGLEADALRAEIRRRLEARWESLSPSGASRPAEPAASTAPPAAPPSPAAAPSPAAPAATALPGPDPAEAVDGVA